MNDVNNRIFREFTEFFDNVEKSASEISVTTAYEITMKSTISTAIIVLESEDRLEERYWNPLRKTKNYNENLFLRTAEGNPMIDKAYKMVLAAA